MRIEQLIIAFIMVPTLVFGESLSFDDAMTPEEKKVTGIDSLPQEKRAQLEAWIGTFIKKAMSQAPSYNESSNLSSWIKTWPDFLRPNASLSAEEKRKGIEKNNMRVFRTYENGKQLELFDGSLWAIPEGDTPRVIRWRRGDIIEATETTAIFPKWVLWNATKKERAGADKLRSSSPTGERPQDPAPYFAGSQAIISLTAHGERITLSDGTSWKVSANHQIFVRIWKQNDRVRYVKDSSDMMFEYTITNLDRGITVNAKKVEN